MITTKTRYRGALLGLAAGDALGTTLEFTRPEEVVPIDDMVGGGPFRLPPGAWTDDTSMALCMATSLVERGGFDGADIMARFVRWYREGYLSSTGECFDIGGTVSRALRRFEETLDPVAGSTDPRSAGNGSLMRLAPIPLWFADDPDRAVVMAAESSRLTHGAPEAVDACRFMAGLLVGAVEGVSKEELLGPLFSPRPGTWERAPLAPAVDVVARGSYKTKAPPAIHGSGYVVEALEAALWAFHRAASFAEGALLAVNLGDDADTTGAIYGQLAGAFWGVEAIPARWRERLVARDLLETLADGLASGRRRG